MMGRCCRAGGSGRMETSPVPSPSNCNWVPTDEIKTSSPIAGPRQIRREGGPNVLFGSMDSKNKGEAVSDVGPDDGPSEVVGCYSKGSALPLAQMTANGLLVPEAEFFAAREDENKRKLQGGVRLTETDRALKEESMRYEKGLSFDHSGDLDEEGRADKSLWLTVYKACNERIKECKEVGGIHCNSDKGREMEGAGVIEDAQIVRSEMGVTGKRVVWQDSASFWASLRRDWRRKS
ncbi:hypothetical protein CK203_064829 [Vitis vinifera]|uniref:Uncharacterized protein n=1 Tax=Vitis vinifera TaxID=29760 RepID=A0A438G743_VITVI|nr:hypothetical protein CK203_064829 [Vitis vinifera]